MFNDVDILRLHVALLTEQLTIAQEQLRNVSARQEGMSQTLQTVLMLQQAHHQEFYRAVAHVGGKITDLCQTDLCQYVDAGQVRLIAKALEKLAVSELHNLPHSPEPSHPPFSDEAYDLQTLNQ